MVSPFESQVTVPDVVGLSVLDAQARAGAAGLKLAQPDPDGPPLSALTWPHADRFRILEQRPAAGATVARWASLVVEYVPNDDGTPGDREPRRPSPAPDVRSAARLTDPREARSLRPRAERPPEAGQSQVMTPWWMRTPAAA